ncbi:MAG TPA: chemotaxis protein CheA, partial [Desulfosporosinus sp.]|nr:chemotaxis protein CheA [Desulfosporosinus sp.]
MSNVGDKTMDIDLGEFLGFYLLDSSEQIERLGAGLLQLEKDGGNIGLINDLFRSAHSLKGASGTMGFTPIVAMTHAAEDLLDRLRQGKMEVSLELIDILLAVTDRVKAMLSQVEQRQEISVGFEDLVSSMRALLNGEKPKFMENLQPTQAELHQEEAVIVPFVPIDFLLTKAETEKLIDSHMMGHGVYQVDVTLAPGTLMKAVRAVMATQRLEGMGTVIKLLPSVEDLEVCNAERFSLLVLCDEPVEEIRRELLEVSELVEVDVNVYPVSDETVEETVTEATQLIETLLSKPKIATEPRTVVLVPKTPITEAVGGESNTPVHTIRVDTVRMDNLINLVGEMVITRTRLVQIGLDLKAQYQMDGMVNNLNEANVYLGRLMNELQESVMRLRMVAIGTVFSRFPRLADERGTLP